MTNCPLPFAVVDTTKSTRLKDIGWFVRSFVGAGSCYGSLAALGLAMFIRVRLEVVSLPLMTGRSHYDQQRHPSASGILEPPHRVQLGPYKRPRKRIPASIKGPDTPGAEWGRESQN